MDNGFPKYQYSVFMKNGRDQQLVVRSNDFDEFQQLIKDIQSVVPEEKTEVTREPVIENTAGIYCMTCKAPAKQKSGVARNGKPYNAIFCSTENRSHTTWL